MVGWRDPVGASGADAGVAAGFSSTAAAAAAEVLCFLRVVVAVGAAPASAFTLGSRGLRVFFSFGFSSTTGAAALPSFDSRGFRGRLCLGAAASAAAEELLLCASLLCAAGFPFAAAASAALWCSDAAAAEFRGATWMVS